MEPVLLCSFKDKRLVSFSADNSHKVHVLHDHPSTAEQPITCIRSCQTGIVYYSAGKYIYRTALGSSNNTGSAERLGPFDCVVKCFDVNETGFSVVAVGQGSELRLLFNGNWKVLSSGGHVGEIKKIVFADRFLVTMSSEDRMVILWDALEFSLGSNAKNHAVSDFESEPIDIDAVQDFCAVLLADSNCLILNVMTGAVVQKIKFNLTVPSGLCLSSNSLSRICASDSSGKLEIASFEGNGLVLKTIFDKGSIIGICRTAETSMIATATSECSLTVWNVDSGEMVQRIVSEQPVIAMQCHMMPENPRYFEKGHPFHSETDKKPAMTVLKGAGNFDWISGFEERNMFIYDERIAESCDAE